MKADQTLDCIGLYCPMPIVKTAEKMKELGAGRGPRGPCRRQGHKERHARLGEKDRQRVSGARGRRGRDKGLRAKSRQGRKAQAEWRWSSVAENTTKDNLHTAYEGESKASVQAEGLRREGGRGGVRGRRQTVPRHRGVGGDTRAKQPPTAPGR